MGKNYWEPSGYDVDDALRDMLCDDRGPSEVKFTEDGVMKVHDYSDGSYKVTEYRDNPNDPRGHDSIDYVYDSNGHIDPSRSGFHNH